MILLPGWLNTARKKIRFGYIPSLDWWSQWSPTLGTNEWTYCPEEVPSSRFEEKYFVFLLLAFLEGLQFARRLSEETFLERFTQYTVHRETQREWKIIRLEIKEGGGWLLKRSAVAVPMCPQPSRHVRSCHVTVTRRVRRVFSVTWDLGPVAPNALFQKIKTERIVIMD